MDNTDPVGPQGPRALSCDPAWIAAWTDAVRHRIASTVADPRRVSVWLATRALLRCLACKRREFWHEGHDVVWMTQRYLLGVEGVTVHAAWSTWREVLDPLVAEGVVRRCPNLVARQVYRWSGADGGYPPRLWMIPDALRATARALLEELAPELLNGIASDADLTSGDWRVVVPLRGPGPSGWQACRCPWHDDRRPSAAVRIDAPGSGSFVCHACERADGVAGRLTAWVVRGPDGEWVARRTDAVRQHPRKERAARVDPRSLVVAAAVDVDAPSTDGHYVSQSVGGVKVPVRRDFPISASRLDHRVDGAGRRVACGLTYTGELAGSLAAAMQRADARSTSDRVLNYVAHVDALREERWQSSGSSPKYLRDPKGFVADRIYSICDTLTERTGVYQFQRREYAVSVSRVLFDLDDVGGLTPTRLAAAIEDLRAVLDAQTCLGGEFVVVQTSPTGVQVVADLAATRDLRWLNSPEVVRWHAHVGRALLAAIHAHGATGGHSDPCAIQPMRHGRRPGWRQLENGSLFRARLVASGELTREHARPATSRTRDDATHEKKTATHG